ncbi:hypothetical protein [Rhodococcus sp. NPDC059234]|uniref:hypothetical protein n=1 Tax=Rhodococcus sp. NPDC059234 TaxID=3346781 RepID=UPI00366F8A22
MSIRHAAVAAHGTIAARVRNTTRLCRNAAFILSAGAIAFAAFSPAAQADTFEHTCTTNPGAYGTGAVRGDYSTIRQGDDRDEFCAVYDQNGRPLGRYSVTDHGYYAKTAVAPPGAATPGPYAQ